MADEPTDAPPATAVPCSPCRGTGQLISRLGGEDHTLDCPWCEGTGVTIPGHDAQAARRAANPQADERPPGADVD